jgi:hypothetical protein
VAIIQKDTFIKATKSINTKYHFVRYIVRTGDIALKLILSAKNIANAFTKPLSKQLFSELIGRFIDVDLANARPDKDLYNKNDKVGASERARMNK